MALVLVEGWDHYASVDAAEKFWNGTSPGMVTGRGFGGQAIEVIVNNSIEKQLPASYSTLIVGAAFKINGEPTDFLRLMAGGSDVVIIGVDSSQHLTIKNAAGSVIATGTTIVPGGRWVYVEIKITVGSSGTCEVHLNGASEITSTTGNYGTASINQIQFETHFLGGNLIVDDVVVMDTTGSAPTNDFLGDVRIETLYPVADASYTDWTPKTGTDHYAMVNEHLIDGDVSFVSDANPGDKDSYKLDTFLGVIYGAQLNIGARKGDSSVRQLKPLILQSGTDYLGDLATLSSDYLFYSWRLDTDPTGGAWLAATINADEFGQELIA